MPQLHNRKALGWRLLVLNRAILAWHLFSAECSAANEAHNRVRKLTAAEAGDTIVLQISEGLVVTEVAWLKELYQTDETFKAEVKCFQGEFETSAIRAQKGRGQIRIQDASLAEKIVNEMLGMFHIDTQRTLHGQADDSAKNTFVPILRPRVGQLSGGGAWK